MKIMKIIVKGKNKMQSKGKLSKGKTEKKREGARKKIKPDKTKGKTEERKRGRITRK